MEYLFSYGTLRRRAVQLGLFGRVPSGARDTLSGYKTTAIEIDDEAFISKGEEKGQLTLEASNGEVVHGIVLEISSEELGLIDRYEPENYKRILLQLDSGNQAWVYLAVKRMAL